MNCLHESRFVHKAAASTRLIPASVSIQSIQRFLWRSLLLEPLAMPTIRSFLLGSYSVCVPSAIFTKAVMLDIGGVIHRYTKSRFFPLLASFSFLQLSPASFHRVSIMTTSWYKAIFPVSTFFSPRFLIQEWCFELLFQ